MKGEGISRESFSLFCPPRLVAQAGQSVLLLCAATGVLEEGVRYHWESLSGDDLRLLSDAESHSPLFTAPSSSAGTEYAYRLTATAPGVYRTSTVTVSVQGVSGETVRGPGLHDECDPLAIPDELGQGCVPWDREPDPSGFGFEGEGGFLFPKAPGLPDRGGGFDSQAPPRLDCPVAVFLEELETGQVECHAWDAAGEEYLDFAWEPVGSTSRDYLDNPRLIPENSPHPSVIAPEAPVHETLESFLSGDRTFRYRYRLTATSRATGLSSHEEVEVYVSSSRPSVYCPLEVSVEEGEAVTLDCEGADPLSFRMAYDEEAASVLWEWEGLWGTSTAPLAGTHLSSPLFTAPAGSAGKEYHYIASMTTSASGVPRMARRRVTVTVVGGGEGAQAAEDAPALANKGSAPAITCNDSEVYEATDNFTLDCSVTNEPSGATYAWTGSDISSRLTNTDSLKATFSVPDDINESGGADKDYEYTVTLSASGINNVTEDITVTVLEKPDINCIIASSILGAKTYTAVEGSPNFTLPICNQGRWAGAPGANPVYTYAWTARGSTPDTQLLSATNIEVPTFYMPVEVGSDETYEYTLTVSAENADDGSVNVWVNVVEVGITVNCEDSSYDVDEGDADIELACEASGAPDDSSYTWSWSPTANLTDHDTNTPTFAVPGSIEQDTTYTYTATASAANAEDGTATVTVTVLDVPPSIACNDSEVYEGAADITLDCTVVSEPSDATYEWAAQGSTANTALLSGATILKPTFSVPEDIPGGYNNRYKETYEYAVTLSADGFADVAANVTVTVLEKPDIKCFFESYNSSSSGTVIYEGFGPYVFRVCPENKLLPKRIPRNKFEYSWTGDTDLISATNVRAPTFNTPQDIPGDKRYYFTFEISAPGENVDPYDGSIQITVRDRPDVQVSCVYDNSVYEGAAAIPIDCTASGALLGSSYTYAWTSRGGTSNTDRLSDTAIASPGFAVPDEVDGNETYEYTLTVSATNADNGRANVTVTVLDKPALALVCTQTHEVYENSEDISLSCLASGAPAGSGYTYEWTVRGDTPDTSLLSAVDIASPTFLVPDEVDANEAYEYLLTVSALNAEDAVAEVTVQVLNRGALNVACASPPLVYEGSADIAFDCEASGAPAGSTYEYVWIPQDDTPDTALLSAADIASPTFYVPDEVAATTTYEYLLTVSAQNTEPATARVTVVVLNKAALAVVCAYPGSVYEGSADIAFDCEASGAPGDNPQYTYAWTASGDTQDTALLSATDIASPVFFVPEEVDATTTYEYLLTVSAANAESSSARVAVTVLNTGALAVVCADPGSAYEGSADIAFDCEASGAPGDNPQYTYAWTASGDTQDTALLSATDIASPVFFVPEEVDATTTYEYLLTVSAANAESSSARVAVTVLNTGALAVVCADPGSAYEGSADIVFDCEASGAPAGSAYEYAWEALGDTPDTALLSRVDIAAPTFYVPDEVAATTTYKYLLTASAENAESGSAEIAVTVLDSGSLLVLCADPGSVYEGSADFDLDCSVSGAPAGSDYAYVWTARGDTPDTDLLIAGTDGPTPTFAVPDALDETTTYEYLLTASAENAEDGSAEVAVTVLDSGSLLVLCADPGSVYEGSADIAFDCEASGAPESSTYEYIWTARGDTPDTALLVSGADGPTPTFATPSAVEETTTYEYLLTVSADNAESGSAEVAVMVLNKEALAVTCADPGSVYEGSEDIAFDCEASGAPESSTYEYAWTARGDTQDTALLSATNVASPTFYVPDEVDEDQTYEYLLTASAENAESGSAEIAVTVLDSGSLLVLCADPGSVYEDSPDIVFDCEASGAPAGSAYEYAWEALGDTPDTALLSRVDIAAPTFYVPDEVASTTTYEYLLTVSAQNAESSSVRVAVTVLDSGSLLVLCADPGSVYEGSPDIVFDCSASGAPGDNPQYTYIWTARGDTPDTALLVSGADGPTPTFATPSAVEETTTYEYLLTVSADNAESGSAEVAVMVLNKEALAVTCADPGSVYEGSEDIAFGCEASGAPESSTYEYAWTARGDTQDTALLSATNVASPTFYVPDEVDEDQTYEYLLTVSADNAESGSAEVAVTVLDRVQEPDPEPVLPPAEEPVADSSPPSALGVTVSASPLRFGVQSADTQVSLDPVTDGLSTHASGLYHSGRMTLAPDGSEPLDENGGMDLSIELASPGVLRREGGTEASLIMLSPVWSLAESCEQLSSQTIGGLYTEVTLSEDACRLLRFGGELDLTDVPSGQYTGSLDLILRSGEREETFAVEATVTVVPAQRVITIGPGGVRFSTSRALSVGLTEEQNLSIYPDVAFLTEGKPHGVFELSNPSLIPLEVSVSARFGYTEATENGREVVVEDVSESDLGDLSGVVDIHPGMLVLMPGDKGLIRYGVKQGALAAMAEQGYAAFFDVVSEPRLYVRSDQMPQEVTGDRTARVTMRVPGVYVSGEGASQLRATLLSISFVGPRSATFLLETQDHPFVGEVVAYDGDGRELGRRETLVYTRSRVRVPLDRIPEEGAVFLRFSPRGSGRVPLPTSVEWDAPRMDIGAAEDEGRTTPPATLVQKP